MVLIVGGAGYIGSHVNKLLAANDYETVVLDNLIYGHREFVKWGTFELGDLAYLENLRLLFKNIRLKLLCILRRSPMWGNQLLIPKSTTLTICEIH